MTKEEIAPAEKFRDELFAKFKKIDGVYHPGKDGLGSEETFSYQNDEDCTSMYIRFDFQMDDRKEIDPDTIKESVVDLVVEMIKDTEFKDLELDVSSDCWDTFTNAFSAHYIEVYLDSEF